MSVKLGQNKGLFANGSDFMRKQGETLGRAEKMRDASKALTEQDHDESTATTLYLPLEATLWRVVGEIPRGCELLPRPVPRLAGPLPPHVNLDLDPPRTTIRTSFSSSATSIFRLQTILFHHFLTRQLSIFRSAVHIALPTWLRMSPRSTFRLRKFNSCTSRVAQHSKAIEQRNPLSKRTTLSKWLLT